MRRWVPPRAYPSSCRTWPSPNRYTRRTDMPTKSKETAPVMIRAKHPSQEKGELKQWGGSASDDFNTILANQVVKALWLTYDETGRGQLRSAAMASLVGIGPKDELEGMLAGQLIAAHSAAMECYRRAMMPEQPFEGWREALTQANKLSRTYATLLEALNRHRGKGHQKVTVEHVHVHQGGQAIVGSVETGGGVLSENQRQPHEPDQQRALASAPSAPVWGEEPGGAGLPSALREGQAPVLEARRRSR